MPAVAVLFTLDGSDQYLTHGSITTSPFFPVIPFCLLPSLPPLSLSLALFVQTGQKLNASAEKQTGRNDPATRVMNLANGAYHRPPLLVLIAAATSRLGQGETGRGDTDTDR